MLKGNLKAKICMLCLNTKCDIDFKVVELIKEVLEIVMPKLNLEEEDEHLICNSCSVKLFAAFNFKSVCTDTEDTIFPYVNSQETPLVELREIYLKEKGDVQSIDILENQKICRLCFQLVRCGFVSLNEVDADIIDNYIPEVNFNATKDPVICKLCSDSLVTHATFLSSCLAAQEENRKVCGDPVEDGECCIKIEETKIEDKDEESNPPPGFSNVEAIENIKGRRKSLNIPVKNKKHPPRKVRTYTCNRCNFKTVHKYNLKRHCLAHVSLTTTYISLKSQCKGESRDPSSPCLLKDQVRMYQCEKCPYRANLRQAIISHLLTHEVPSAVKVYQCEKCHYRSIRKDHFRRHQLRHEDGGKVEKYTCDKCDFQTRYKCSLFEHQLLHKKKLWKDVKCYTGDDGELTYKCNVCKYETKDKRQLFVHQSDHPHSSRQPKFKCRMCPYESDNKDKLTRHQSKHNSGMKTFKCDLCFFQTIFKNNFVRHQLRHKNKCKVMYSCFKCNFGTKYKDNLKRHIMSLCKDACNKGTILQQLGGAK